MKKLICLCFIVIISIFSFCYAADIEVPKMIRIGIDYNSGAVSSLKLTSAGGITFGTMNSNDEFTFIGTAKKDEILVITKGSTAYSVNVEGYGEFGTETEFPYFKSNEYDDKNIISIDGKKYRGNVELRRIDGKNITVINHLSMQEYLYGVVPREIGGNSPLEAVKAQAIVARTYAVKNYNKRIGLGFNLYPNTDDQAYGGYEWENANSNKAVDETDGLVVTYNGELIGGYYFSTSGGYTESSENVWSSPVDYLKAVPDFYEPEVEGNTTWEVTLTADEVKADLKKNGIDVGEIVNLVPKTLSESGRVIELQVIGTDGTATVTKSNTRSYFGLKSQWYTINEAAPEVNVSENIVMPVAGQNDTGILDTVKTTKSTEKASTSKQNVEVTVNEDAWFLKETTEDKVVSNSDNYVATSGEFVKTVDISKIVIDEEVSKVSGDSKEVGTKETKNTTSKVNKEDSKEASDSKETNSTNVEYVSKEAISQEVKNISGDSKDTSDNLIKISGDSDSENIIVETKPLMQKILDCFAFLFGKNTSNGVVNKADTVKAVSSKATFTFRGRGWGHGIGMSQNGAKGMAEAGFSAEEIIKWYYTGVKISY